MKAGLPSPTFCALPFEHLFLSEEGKSYPCCYSLESGAVNRDENKNPISVSSFGDVERAWNSPTQRALRVQLKAGERPEGCSRCFGLERHGLQSLREIANRDTAEKLTTLAARTQADGSMPLHFSSVDLRLGNLCNLRCQMCSPVSSKKLVKDFQEIYPDAATDFAKMGEISWHKDISLLTGILAHADDLREAHFAGGEPFLIPEVASIITKLAERPDAKNISLSFNSNLTHIPENLFALFPRFRGVRLVASIDGLGAVNDYIRYPSKFREIEANLERLHERRKEWNLREVCFNVTVQIHNIFEVPVLVNYLAEKFPAFLPFPILGALNVPDCLSVKVLPADAKASARKVLEKFIRDGRPYWSEWENRIQDRGAAKFEKEVRGLIEFMDSEDRTDLLPEFHRFTGVIERIRGQKLVVPELPGAI
ncbi:MAG: twitch domain-containing radical SAM protein [Bdellovibrionota bacterium]